MYCDLEAAAAAWFEHQAYERLARLAKLRAGGIWHMPGKHTDAPLTRADFDALIAPVLRRVAALEAERELLADPVPVSAEIQARIDAHRARPHAGVTYTLDEARAELGLQPD